MRITPEIILFPSFFPDKIAVADFLAPSFPYEILSGAVPKVVDFDDHRTFVGDGDVPSGGFDKGQCLLEFQHLRFDAVPVVDLHTIDRIAAVGVFFNFFDVVK